MNDLDGVRNDPCGRPENPVANRFAARPSAVPRARDLLRDILQEAFEMRRESPRLMKREIIADSPRIKSDIMTSPRFCVK